MVVVTEERRRRDLAEVCGETAHVERGREPWLSLAPVHVVVCVRADDYRERYLEADKVNSTPPDQWHVPFWWVDAGAALMLLLLAAVDEGLAAGVLQIADPAAVRRVLALPADVATVALVTVGHPADDPGPVGSGSRGRRNATQTTHWQRWNG